MPKGIKLKDIPHLLSLKPLPTGTEAPQLSLTAEEGTWIKSKDFTGHLNILLVFFRSLLDDRTDDYLKSLQKEISRFEALNTVIFGVTQFRTERLRQYRGRQGLEFHLLYDPLALCARRFGCSGRIRPYCKPSVILLDRNGKIILSQRGYLPTSDLLSKLASLEGTTVPETDSQRTFTGIRDPGAPAASANSVTAVTALGLLSDSDSNFKLLDVRTPEEFAQFHIEGAINIPLDELPHRYQELEQTTHIICLSKTGGLSEAAAEFLTSIGASQVFNVEDGLAAWPGASKQH